MEGRACPLSSKLIKCELRRQIRSPGCSRQFLRARLRQTAFRPYHSINSLLTVLRKPGAADYAAKEAITRALISEFQNHPSPLWSLVLIAAYLPMLRKLRASIRAAPIKDSDLDQYVILAFLEVVRSFELTRNPRFTAIALKQRTRRRFLGYVRHDLNEYRFTGSSLPEGFEERLDLPNWPPVRASASRIPRLPAAEEAKELANLLAELAGNVLGEDRLNLITATYLYGEDLHSYAARTAPAPSPEARQQQYARLKRQRSRAIAELRVHLAKILCPQSDDGCLCDNRDTKPEEAKPCPPVRTGRR